MAATETQNTLQQDLLLLAKNHYTKDLDIDPVIAARAVIAHHIAVPVESVSLRDIAFWLLKEFADPGIILSMPGWHVEEPVNPAVAVTEFLLELGHGHGWTVPPKEIPAPSNMLPAGEPPINPLDGMRDKGGCREYRYNLILALMSEIREVRVRNNEEWLLPFPEAVADPVIQRLVNLAGESVHA